VTVPSDGNDGPRTARWLEVIADPIRLTILRSLSQVEEATASDLATWSQASSQTLRRHLEALVSLGVIREHPARSDGETPGRPPARFSLPAEMRESVRSILADTRARARFVAQLSLIGGLLAVFISEIIYGAELIVHWSNHSALDTLGNLMIASLFIGVARAWEFVGDRDTGIWASLMVLATGHERSLNDPDAGSAESGESPD